MSPKLREMIPEGVHVVVRHYRRFPGYLHYYTRGDLPGMRPEPKGGSTEAWLVSDGRVIAIGHADCSEKDNYSKAIGRNIAIGRALARLNSHDMVVGLA